MIFKIDIYIYIYIYVCVCVCVCVCKKERERERESMIEKNAITEKKLMTVVEGDQKAPFSIATTQRCRGGRYSFPRIAPLYH